MTLLAYEIEKWDETGNSYVWVRVPQVDASNTDFIWMYYGNPTIGDGQNPTGVWDADFKLVHHLKETAGAHVDSTSNPNDSIGRRRRRARLGRRPDQRRRQLQYRRLRAKRGNLRQHRHRRQRDPGHWRRRVVDRGSVDPHPDSRRPPADRRQGGARWRRDRFRLPGLEQQPGALRRHELRARPHQRERHGRDGGRRRVALRRGPVDAQQPRPPRFSWTASSRARPATGCMPRAPCRTRSPSASGSGETRTQAASTSSGPSTRSVFRRRRQPALRQLDSRPVPLDARHRRRSRGQLRDATAPRPRTAAASASPRRRRRITVNGPNRFDIRFNTASGGGIDRFIDAEENTGVDLAGGHRHLPGRLIASTLRVGGLFYNSAFDTQARLELLEATPARTRVRQSGRLVRAGGRLSPASRRTSTAASTASAKRFTPCGAGRAPSSITPAPSSTSTCT